MVRSRDACPVIYEAYFQVVTFLNSGGKIGDTLKAVSAGSKHASWLQIATNLWKEVTCDKCSWIK